MKRSRIMLPLAAVLALCALTVLADLRDYAPTQATVTTSSGTLLAADNRLQVVTLTNVGDYDVWVCHAGQTAEANKGFYLPADGTVNETIASVSANAAFSVTEDTADHYNVYWDTDQNKVGDNKNIRVGFYGL